MVYASMKSKKKLYHMEWCPCVKRIDKRFLRKMKTYDIAKEQGYSECAYCGGTHGAYKAILRNPMMFGRIRKSFWFTYDWKDRALCVRTSSGFWKIIKGDMDGLYRLYHLNRGSYDPAKTDYELMHGTFHRQKDVHPAENLERFMPYIYEHDKAKIIMDQDWRKLPKKTKKQKKYYRQAEKRASRNKKRRLDEIFDKIEKGVI